MNDHSYYLYRITETGEGEIYGKFSSLTQAELSAHLLLIKELCFILSSDFTKIYFYNEDGTWDYDIMTDTGKEEFLQIYPNPLEYK